MLSVSPSSVSFNLVQGEGFTGLRGRVAKTEASSCNSVNTFCVPSLKNTLAFFF